MEPRIIQPAKQLAALLKQHERARGVIDYVIFENIDPAEISIGFHKAAAIDALREIDRRLKRAASQRAFELDEDINAFPRVRLNAEKIKGHKIDKNEFLGPCYAAKEQKLIVRGDIEPFLNSYFLAGAELTAKNLLQIDTNGKYVADGYAQAFCEPPYGIDLDAKQLNDLFHRIGQCLYGDLSDPLDIYDWAGSWSNYFDAGAEWWGAYLWTVCNLKSGQFTVIGASTTD